MTLSAARSDAGPLRLRPGLRILPDAEASGDVLVWLNSRVLRLRGQGVRRVLDLLDGTRTLDEVCLAMHPAPRVRVAAAVEQLRGHGLLEPALDGPAAALPAPLLRALHDLGVEAGAVARVLAAGAAGVVGEGPLADAVAEALRHCGVGRVVADGAATARDDVDVAVVALGAQALEPLERFNVLALRRGLPWIHLQAGGLEVTVGPFVLPGETACFTCYQLRSEANLAAGAEGRLAVLEAARRGDVPPAPGDDLPPGVARLAAELSAVEVVRFFASRVSALAPALYGSVAEYALLWHRATVSRVLRLPRCPACGARAAGHPPVRAWMEPYDHRNAT